jgi:trimeric autotransporter adhesin
MNHLIRRKSMTSPVFITLSLFFFALLPKVQPVVPPPDGGYANFTTAEGQNALFSLTTGSANTAVGWFSLFSDTDGSFNTATGTGALLFNTADNNTAFGAAALLFNTTGSDNTAIGTAALLNNIGGDNNNAVGVNALRDNTVGNFNNAHGRGALRANIGGSQNNAFGDLALGSVVSGDFNTAIGDDALFANVSGDSNTAVGDEALAANTASENTAVGAHALDGNTTASENTAVGFQALAASSGPSNSAFGHRAMVNSDTASFNTAIGKDALLNTTGSGNVALGARAGDSQTTGSGNIYIGVEMHGFPGENNACYIRAIFGETSATGIPVLINSNHKLGTATSSKRFKEEIKPMDKASEAILGLTPVSFRYTKEVDPAGTTQFGLVAEDVEKVNPDLVARDKEGKPYSVRYDQVNAMLLNEFLKEHRKNEEQQAIIMQLKSTDAKQEAIIAQQQKQIDALTAGLRRVSAQLELSKPAPQTVKNND